MKYTPNNIQSLESNQIFVYGANQAGRHGAGAAKLAFQKFGAKYGETGLVGQSYGICTKDKYIRTMPINEIAQEIKNFLKVAEENSELEFIVTLIGCGLAGYKTDEIAVLWHNEKIPQNVILPVEFSN